MSEMKCVRAEIDNEKGTLCLEFRNEAGIGEWRVMPFQSWWELIQAGHCMSILRMDFARYFVPTPKQTEDLP